MNGGLCVQILSPFRGQVFSCEKGRIPVRVQVNLACGCPAGAGGRWDYRRFRLEASFAVFGREPVRIPLAPSDEVGIFTGSMELEEPGEYVLEIGVYDPETGMAGRKRLEFRKMRSD